LSALVSLTPVTATHQGFQIQAPADMLTALQYISPGGGLNSTAYGGVVNSQNVNGTVTWNLLINNSQANTSQTAHIGDYIVLTNNSIVNVVPQASFASLYTSP
jgi:hypothetical protein